jgi:hypothetical protein
MPIEMLRCYDCGDEYGHIGTAPHPGRCPACDSVCVPPAGELTVVDRPFWRSANGLSKARIRAVDAHERQFVWEVVAKGSRGTLVAVEVDGVRIDARGSDRLTPLPAVIEDAIAELGVGDVETGRLGQIE